MFQLTERIAVAPELEVSAELLTPPGAVALFVYAHGAGAPMHHRFMEASSEAFARRGIATLRFNFPYSEAGRRRPDGKNKLVATIRAATLHAAALRKRSEHIRGDVPIFAGGKSMGGRMSSHADLDPETVRGLIFVGFPLHRPKQVSTERAAHLPEVDVPMLFLQGTRDALADLSSIREVCSGVPRATLRVIEGADHGFHVLKRSGRTDDEVIAELADATRGWIDAQR